MHPRISIDGLSSFNQSFIEDIALAQRVGATAITVPFMKIAQDVPAAIAAIIAGGYNPVMLAGGSAGGLIGGLDSVKASIDAARAMGCPGFYTVSGPPPNGMSTDQAFAALIEALGPIMVYAGEQGVGVAIEHTSVSTRSHGFVHSFADAVDLSKETGIQIDLELQNVWYERRLPQLFRENIDRIVLVQVSDFRVGDELRMNRSVPGDGDIPLEWLIGELLGAGYAGFFDIEVLGPHIEAEGYESALRRSIDWLSECLTRLGA